MSYFRLFQNRNNKFSYYTVGHLRRLYPKALLSLDLDKLQHNIQNFDADYMNTRLNYYNKINKSFILGEDVETLKEMRPIHGTYSLDTLEHTRFFSPEKRLAYVFGDVTHVPSTPSIVKSRPVTNNDYSILLKLDKIRHFYFVNDTIEFKNKENTIVWRGAAHSTQQYRVDFLKKFYKHSKLFNVGSFIKNNQKNSPYTAPFMSINNQLKSKFILSIEGNDVATNTKWIMSSNSVCFMIKPKFETWFMEGMLKPNHHYVLIKNDYSNLEEKINYYIDNPLEAKLIVNNANQYVAQFMNKKSEDWLSLKVLEKYFQLSGQMHG